MEEGGKGGGLLELPSEVLMEIFGKVSMEDLCELSKVCKVLHLLSSDDSLWRPFCCPSWCPPLEGQRYVLNCNLI